MSDDLAELAADAYIHGFPLVFDLQMADGQAELGMIKSAPVNSFGHASRLAGPIAKAATQTGCRRDHPAWVKPVPAARGRLAERERPRCE